MLELADCEEVVATWDKTVLRAKEQDAAMYVMASHDKSEDKASISYVEMIEELRKLSVHKEDVSEQDSVDNSENDGECA